MTSSCPTSAVVVGASGGIGGAFGPRARRACDPCADLPLSRLASSEPQGVRTLPIDQSDEATVTAAAAWVGEAEPIGLVVVATSLFYRAGVSPEKTVGAPDPAEMAGVFSVNTIGPAVELQAFRAPAGATAGHFDGHAVLHDRERKISFCGDALKFELDPDPRRALTISAHKAFVRAVTLTSAELLRYRVVFASLEFEQTWTPLEQAANSSMQEALALIDTMLTDRPHARPVALRDLVA